MEECRSDECGRITKETWAWVIDYNIWLSVAYIPEKQKVVADKLSREFNMLAGGQLPLTIRGKKCPLLSIRLALICLLAVELADYAFMCPANLTLTYYF